MTLDPQIQEVLRLVEQAGYPDYWQLTPAQARAQFEKTAPVLDARRIALHRIENRRCPGPAGEIPLRLYWPRPARQPLPVLLWLHGGGFVLGGLDSYDALCRQLARRADCLVVSVDYRLAPEHKFPAAVEDCQAALDWTAAHAGTFGADPTRIAIAGDSAGGNLSTVVSRLARDAGGPKPVLQLLIYPGTAADTGSESQRRYGEGYLLSQRSIRWFYDHYLNDPAEAHDPRFAPLLANDLGGLPPALVMVAGYDPLHDEGVAYAERLRAAGNRVELIDYADMVHAFFSMSGAVGTAREALERAARALRDAFGAA